MLASQIHKRQSAMRTKIRALMNKSEKTDGEKVELASLLTEQEASEVELREALSTEVVETIIEGEDAQARERREVRGKSLFSNFVSAAISGRVPTGAEAEYASAMNAGPGQIPIDLFEADRPVEARADAVTPAPATGTGVTVAPIQPFIFSQSIAPRLGIEMPSVGSGSYSEMTITTLQSAAAVTKGSAKESTAGALTAVTASARRFSVRLSMTLEDIANVGQANFDSALRQNARGEIGHTYDDACINGNGTAPNVDGLINQLTNPTSPTTLAKFDDYVTAFANSIDGLWAAQMSEVSIVANVDAYKLSAKIFSGMPQTIADQSPLPTTPGSTLPVSGLTRACRRP